MKKTILAILLIALLMLSLGCKNDRTKYSEYIDDSHCALVISVENFGDMVFKLDKNAAPLTVEHIKKLADNNSMDGTYFNRMQAGFVLQGGTGCTDTSTVKGEFSANGVDNTISHSTGVISMARSSSYDSASCQFFIVLSNNAKSSLDGLYAGFGKLVEGLDVLNSICNSITSTDFMDGYYGTSMGFLKDDSYIKITEFVVYD